MLISTSITRSKGRYTQSFEPPLSLYVKQAIGAAQAANFDLSNACAGMLTGVFILQDLVARGDINCGMVVSGEYISHLSWNAARQIRSLFSKQLALLTLGDAGAAVIVERAPSGCGVDVIGFTTLAEHSRLCLAFPSTAGPGAQMYTKSRTLQKVAIDDMAPLVAEAIGEAGIDLADIDFMIPHQTSARAIRAGTQEFVRRLGARPKHVVVIVFDDLGEILPGGRVVSPHCTAPARLPACPPRRETREPKEAHHAPHVRDAVHRDRRLRSADRGAGQEAPRERG